MAKSRSLKILFLAKSTPIYGGVERWLADLAISLENSGHDCVVALAKGAVFHCPKAYKIAYPQLRTVELDGLTGSAVGRQMAVMSVLKEVSPDIVVPVMLGDGLEVAAFMKAKLGYKLIYPVHEIGDGIANDLSRHSAYIDSTVFVDESSKQRFQYILPSTSHSEVLHCGVPETVVNRTESSKLRIGYCGRIAPQKRVMDLVPLCAELDKISQSYTLKIIGAGPTLSDLRAGLGVRLDSAPGEEAKVTIVAPIDRDRLYEEFYNNIDLLIITSDWETGPLVAFEAMMNRVVVITSDFNGRNENNSLIDEENCLVFPIGNMYQAAKHIRRMAWDIEFKEKILTEAYEYSFNYRGLTAMCRSWEALMLKLANQKTDHLENPNKNDFSKLFIHSSWQRAKENLKRKLGLKFIHKHAGEEWPFFSFKK